MKNDKKELLDKVYSECLDPDDSPFGMWINALFSVVTSVGEDLTFPAQKELFFQLLERLLKEGRVVLIPPYELSKDAHGRRREDVKRRTQNGDDRIWDEDPGAMVAYMRRTFPLLAQHKHDGVLNEYWYSTACPQIGWVHPETGELVFS